MGFFLIQLALLRNNIVFGSCCHDALRKSIDFDLAIGKFIRKKFWTNSKRK